MKGFLIFLLVAALAVLGMYYAGWISWGDTPEQSEVQFHKDEAQKDTRETIQKGKELIRGESDEPVEPAEPR